MAKHKDLIIFQKADRLAHKVYQITRVFPKSELYGLTSQLRRAAISVSANIVEGYARSSKKELKRFLDISLGSLAETEYLVAFSRELGYHDNLEVNSMIDETGKVLWSFYRRL